MVVDNPKKWPLKVPGVEIIQSKRYITESAFTRLSGARVFNLSRSYGYQSIGYYVSLLAAARGHRPVPSVTTMRDLQNPSMVRRAGADLEDLIRKSLAPLKSDDFILSIYFGKNLAKRNERLSKALFNTFHAPLLRAHFTRGRNGWGLQNISEIGIVDVPESHYDFVIESAAEYFGNRTYARRRKEFRFTLAILHKPDDAEAPSNRGAIKRFIAAGQTLGIGVELITREDYGRLAEYDGLFIRETTSVANHTFRFARRAETEGMAVIDDPESILLCTNKVYLAERLGRLRIRTPKTLILHRENLDVAALTLGLPCVLKRPDSSFSQGVIKVATRETLEKEARAMLERSELIIAQEYLPTEFDWRVGVLDGEVLYVCRYYMAGNHWQIIHRDAHGRTSLGTSDTLKVEDAPADVVRLALRATRAIGRGLYGVDIKQVGRTFYVIEVNDNPNLDHGVEDEVLQDELYTRIMRWFLRRMEARGERHMVKDPE